mmetsp:Transcript_55197/g.102194  ORF Transcript_55197/g.102194 Transcript_55197/m.102194 type:complete len:203 (-) Transcript_55197:178-786(-)
MAILNNIQAMAQTKPKRTASNMSPSTFKAKSRQMAFSLALMPTPPAAPPALADTSALFRALRPWRLSRTSLPARLLCRSLPPVSSSEELKVSAGMAFSEVPLGGPWTVCFFPLLAPAPPAGSDAVVAMLTDDKSLGGPFACAAIRAISAGGSGSAPSLRSATSVGNRGGSGGGGGTSSLAAGTAGLCQGIVPITCMTEGSTA